MKIARPWLVRLAALALAVLLVWLAARDVRWSALAAVLGAVEARWLAFAVVTISLSVALRGWRWWRLIGPASRLPLLPVLAATATGYLGNAYMPARGGDLLRVVLLGRALGLAKSYLLGTGLAERLGDVAVLMMIAAVLLPRVAPAAGWIADAGAVAAVLAALALIGLWLWPRLVAGGGLRPRGERWLAGLNARARWLGYGARLLSRFAAGARVLTLAAAGPFAMVTAAAWLVDGATIWFLTLAIGAPLPYALAMVFVIALALASAAPSTPGYIGVYQIVAVTVLVPFGMNDAEALAVSILYQLVTYGVFTVSGLLSLRLLWSYRRGRGASEPPGKAGQRPRSRAEESRCR